MSIVVVYYSRNKCFHMYIHNYVANCFRNETSIRSYSCRLATEKKREIADKMGKELEAAGTSTISDVQSAATIQPSTSSHTISRPLTVMDIAWDDDISDEMIVSVMNENTVATAQMRYCAPVFNNCSNITINYGVPQ